MTVTIVNYNYYYHELFINSVIFLKSNIDMIKNTIYYPGLSFASNSIWKQLINCFTIINIIDVATIKLLMWQ